MHYDLPVVAPRVCKGAIVKELHRRADIPGCHGPDIDPEPLHDILVVLDAQVLAKFGPYFFLGLDKQGNTIGNLVPQATEDTFSW
jgi:hypothetical protein